MPDLYPRLWRFSLTLTGARDTAEDLAQTTSLRALEKAHHYTPGTKLDSWLFKMAQRIWLNELRANAVRKGGGLFPVEDLDLPSNDPDSETNYFTRQVLSQVNALPEAQRASVMLVYVEGFSYAEAADTLDVPIGTIMSRLSAARKTIGQQMNPQSVRTSP